MCVICHGGYNWSTIKLECYHCYKVANIPELPNLEYLDCIYCWKLTTLPILHKLKKLECSWCAELSIISKLPKLEELNCSSCCTLNNISNLPKLKVLSCGYCTSLINILELPALEKFYYCGCPLLYVQIKMRIKFDAKSTLIGKKLKRKLNKALMGCRLKSCNKYFNTLVSKYV